MTEAKNLMKLITEKKEKLEALRADCIVIYKQQEQINSEIEELTIKYVFESNMLLTSTWALQRQKNIFNLYATDRSFKLLCDILRKDYHCSVTLCEGVELRFDDWEIRIIFKNVKIAIDFIKKYGLKTNLKEFEDELKNMIIEIDNLKQFVEMFKDESILD